MDDDDRYVLLRHERVHLRQRARAWATSRWRSSYLVPFFPLFLAWGRARIEWEAYEETHPRDRRGPRPRRGRARSRPEIVRRFVGPRLRLDVAVPARRAPLVRRGHRRLAPSAERSADEPSGELW